MLSRRLPEWANRTFSSDEQTVILAAFIRHYFWSYGEAPPGPVEGMARGLLAGELRLQRGRPQTWPLNVVASLLTDCVAEVEALRAKERVDSDVKK